MKKEAGSVSEDNFYLLDVLRDCLCHYLLFADMGMQLMTNMRKKNHLTLRGDLSTFDNFFQSTISSETMIIKRLMTVSGQKSKNVFDMVSNAVS